MAKGDLEGWFSANLPLLGLNEKEKAQFMEYWLERLSESAYYEIVKSFPDISASGNNNPFFLLPYLFTHIPIL